MLNHYSMHAYPLQRACLPLTVRLPTPYSLHAYPLQCACLPLTVCMLTQYSVHAYPLQCTHYSVHAYPLQCECLPCTVCMLTPYSVQYACLPHTVCMLTPYSVHAYPLQCECLPRTVCMFTHYSVHTYPDSYWWPVPVPSHSTVPVSRCGQSCCSCTPRHLPHTHILYRDPCGHPNTIQRPTHRPKHCTETCATCQTPKYCTDTHCHLPDT